MGSIRRTASARRDFREIWSFIALDNPTAADNMVRRLDAALEMLSDHPRAGPLRPELRPRLRSYPVGSYIIFYRPTRNGIELVRVLHGARDLRRIFRRR